MKISSCATLGYAAFDLGVAVELEVPLIVVPIGPRELNETVWQSKADAAVPVLRMITDYGGERGVKVCMEAPHLYLLADTCGHTRYFLDRVDDLGLVIDTSHWGIIGYDLQQFLCEVGDRLWHVHLRDSRGSDTRDFKQELEYRIMDLTIISREFTAGIEHLEHYRWKVSR